MTFEIYSLSLLERSSCCPAFSSKYISECMRQQTFSCSMARCPSYVKIFLMLSFKRGDCSKLSKPPIAHSSIIKPSLKMSSDFYSSGLVERYKVLFMKFL